MDRRQVVAGLIGATALAGCSRGLRPVIVGSKNFTEQVILGEIAAQHIETRMKARVERRLNLGGTLLAHQSLLSRQIDLYPEYTGTALTSILRLPLDTNPDSVYDRVRREYEMKRLLWMPPLGFNNSFAMTIRGDDARAARLSTLSGAQHYPGGWALGAGYEFMERPDGFAGLMRVYRLPLKAAPQTMDLGLLYQALLQKQVNMAAGSRTDGLLSKLDLKVLEDDQHAFPPYQAAYVVHADAMAAHPGLSEALGELSGKLSATTMQALNYAVDGEHQPVAEVARKFLRDAGL